MSFSSMDMWRLHDELSVVNAAILMIGGDPSDQSQYWDDNTKDTYWDQRRDYVGFEAAFGALKSAIRRGALPATLSYDAIPRWYGTGEKDGFRLVTPYLLERIVEGLDSDPFFIMPRDGALGSRGPTWEKTNILVEDLKRWLRGKGLLPEFFFPAYEAETSDTPDLALNPEHEHFAPELAMAITAWQALLPERTFKGGVKAAIEAWIAANPDAWQGENPISGGAIERIATLVNWNKSGGAPRSNG